MALIGRLDTRSFKFSYVDAPASLVPDAPHVTARPALRHRSVKRRRGHRGRPRKADAKRRKTTVAERAPFLDFGSPELLCRKARLGHDSEAPVELVDVAGALRAHGLIDAEELATVRLVAEWLRSVAKALHLSRASPTGLWAAIMSGNRGGGWRPLNPGGGDAALFRLSQLYRHFTELDQLGRLVLCIEVADGQTWPATQGELLELRAALAAIASLQKHGRRSAPAAATAPAPA